MGLKLHRNVTNVWTTVMKIIHGQDVYRCRNIDELNYVNWVAQWALDQWFITLPFLHLVYLMHYRFVHTGPIHSKRKHQSWKEWLIFQNTKHFFHNILYFCIPYITDVRYFTLTPLCVSDHNGTTTSICFLACAFTALSKCCVKYDCPSIRSLVVISVK